MFFLLLSHFLLMFAAAGIRAGLAVIGLARVGPVPAHEAPDPDPPADQGDHDQEKVGGRH
jgi:hypothetical protein